MQNKKITFSVSNRRKCIANLCTLLMYFSLDFAKYRTQKVMKEIVSRKSMKIHMVAKEKNKFNK